MPFKTTTAILSLLATTTATTTTAKAITVPRASSSAESAITTCPPNQLFYHSEACIPAIPCGGLANLPCPAQSQVCVDDPRDDCDPKKAGAADCGGICVEPTKRCVGMLGLMCPEGWECVDDARDECVPEKWEVGGEVCLGICV
ncbi:hypothetical protein QBC32DRAFT_179862, partial [Pseudoneurospora amorphoporcata]